MSRLGSVHYVFIVGLGWCPRSRQLRDLTVSLTHMANMIEINKVPIIIFPHLQIKIVNFRYPFCNLFFKHLFRCNIEQWLTNSDLKYALLVIAALVMFAMRFFPRFGFQTQRLLQNPFLQAILFKRLWWSTRLLIFRSWDKAISPQNILKISD